MTCPFESAVGKWLQAYSAEDGGPYRLTFAEHHLGNVWIRSLHGGVSASMIELCAEAEVRKQVGDKPALDIFSSSVDYLRITRDADLFARPKIVRISRRLAVVEVSCWQDDENLPVVQGVVTLKITQDA